MKCIVFERFGPPEVLQLQHRELPRIKADELLVKVLFTAVTSADSRIRAARFTKGFGLPAKLFFGIRTPRRPILGSSYSGIVEQVGADVSGISPGDEVCGMTGIHMGTYAQYIKVAADSSIVPKPATVSHEDAAGVLFGGTAALYFMRDRAELKAGETVLVNGASGAVGTNAVQLARYYHARVTAVTSARNARLLRSLGAEAIIDHEQQRLSDAEQRFDVVLDTVGNLSIAQGVKLLGNNGRLVLMAASLQDTLRGVGKVKTGTAPEKAADIEFLLSLVASGQLQVIIDSIHDMDNVVAAHAHVDSGRKVGNVLLRMH